MPKKSTRNVREQKIDKRQDARRTSGSSDVIVKHFRTIHINVKNAKRWFYVKKRLALVTDDELAAYLLDLAEPIVRRDGKCASPEDWKTDGDKENDSEVAKVDEKDVLSGEEPLRRSPRKQCIPVAQEAAPPSPVSESATYKQPESQQLEVSTVKDEPRERRRSRTKHHKTKAKHHRDKRSKRKHSKNSGEDKNVTLSDAERSVLSRVDSESPAESIALPKIHKSNFTSLPKLVVELTPLDEKDNRSGSRATESCAVLAESCNKTKNESAIFIGQETRSNFNGKEKTPPNGNKSTNLESNCTFDASAEVCNNDNYSAVESFGNNEEFNEKERNISSASAQFPREAVLPAEIQKKKTNDEKRPKKKRKHAKQESPQVDNDAGEKRTEEGSDSPVAVAAKENLHKRHKKKHKHAADHKTKRYHDVRKAPHDGKVAAASESAELSAPAIRDASAAAISSGGVVESATTATEVDGLAGEPQRLAIKIKLCQDCNERHIEDACPLVSTEYVIADSVAYKDWLDVHKHNPEVQKAMGSEDPMSEGYAVTNDDAFESDDESPAGEQYKNNKTKLDSEDKQLHVSEDRPLYSRESLPECFELKTTSPEHGIGIYARQALPIYAKLGPLVGDPVKEMDIPDDFSMRHIWEINDDGKTSYISTTNPLKSNWIRYMRPADSKDERTVAVVTKHGELHLVTTQNITTGMELTYWADSQSSTWTRKNKIDKTNCGGCNLNFTHPIYYRLHCCIFHDTNYSLTIRKYHCKICGAAVLGKDNIMKHAAELHGGRGAYQCQYCRKFFLRLNYLEMHRTYGCSQNPQRSRPLCDFCGRKFCQPQKLKVHIKRMHSDMSEVLREFQCKLCLKLLGSRAALQRHMKEVHHKDVVAAATCDRCGKMFQNKSNLKIHMLTHSGVKPFKCKENDCKAAFTTKQCLQFHYKKVHGLSEDMMPKIERSVAYTFDAYSGGLVEDVGRGKSQTSGRRGSQTQQQDNSNSLLSLDDCSSEHSSRAEVSMSSFHATINDFETVAVDPSRCDSERDLQDLDLHDSEVQEREIADRELEESPQSPAPPPSHQEIQMTSASVSPLENIRPSPEVDFYGTSRLQSKGSKKWMGEFNPPNDPELVVQQQQQQQHQQQHSISSQSRSADVYEFEEKKDESRNDVVSVAQSMINESKLGLNIYRRAESTNASLLVEAALDAAERDIGAVSSPILDDNDRDGNLYSISSQLQSPLPSRSSEHHLDSYIQQQEDLMSPNPTSDSRKTPPSHVQIDYHLHRPVDYINSPRTHNIEQYLPQDELPRVSSPGGYIHMPQDDLTSPSATPNPNRYPEIHHHRHHHQHQVPTDNLSSDEGDSVAQNLSLSVKEKSLQLDLSTTYKYDGIDTEFCRERANFEPLVLNSGELQGLDMSARGFHHGLTGQIPNSRYHHHLYEITERQSVDLSRTSGYSMSPPPAYPHSEVLRIVSLDLTPGHSVDLSLSRSHHLHGNGARVITSPQPAGTNASHVVPDTIDGRILSPPPPPPPPPSIPGYNATYPVSPAPYHPPRPGYHHYSGYY